MLNAECNVSVFITARIRRMGKVLFSQVSVCPWGGGGVPHLHTIILPLVPCPFWGVPHLHPIIPPLVPVLSAGTPQDRTAERALATRQAVCLLRSRRRTVLLRF